MGNAATMHSWYHGECTTTVPQLHCLLLIILLPEQVLTAGWSTFWTTPSPPPAVY